MNNFEKLMSKGPEALAETIFYYEGKRHMSSEAILEWLNAEAEQNGFQQSVESSAKALIEYGATLEKAVYKWGRKTQIDKAVEEMSELTTELMHYKGGRLNGANVAEELADVAIMAFQLIAVFGVMYDIPIAEKLERLKERLSRNDD